MTKRAKAAAKTPQKTGAARNTVAPPVLHVLEEHLGELGTQLQGKPFDSVPQAEAFLAELMSNPDNFSLGSPATDTDLEKAQAIIYDALGEGSQRKWVQLAKKALTISPGLRRCLRPARRGDRQGRRGGESPL